MKELLIKIKEYIEDMESSYNYGINNATDEVKSIYTNVCNEISSKEENKN